MSNFEIGDLIEINHSGKSTSYMARLDMTNKPMEMFLVPDHTIAVWLGREPVDLGIEWVTCDIVLYDNRRYVVFNGDVRIANRTSTE
jgi:hypothetical protein